MKKSALVPTSTTALRFAAILHRRSDTKWNEKKEIIPFRKLFPHVHEEELAMVERYYKALWPPRCEKNILRHDLATLINNWSGEVDRARVWCESHEKKAPRKIIPLPPPAETLLSETERAQSIAEFERIFGRKPGWASA